MVKARPADRPLFPAHGASVFARTVRPPIPERVGRRTEGPDPSGSHPPYGSWGRADGHSFGTSGGPSANSTSILTEASAPPNCQQHQSRSDVCPDVASGWGHRDCADYQVPKEEGDTFVSSWLTSPRRRPRRKDDASGLFAGPDQQHILSRRWTGPACGRLRFRQSKPGRSRAQRWLRGVHGWSP